MNVQIKSEKSSLPARVFFSPGERRLRAGWRIMVTLLVILVSLLGIQFLRAPWNVIFQSLMAVRP